MNKKIGLAIVTYTVNYGTYLQAFATQTSIRKLGYDTEIINIESVIDDVSRARKKYFLGQLLNFAEVKSYSSTIEAIIEKKINFKYRKYICGREEAFKKFHDQYFDIGAKYDSWSGLAKSCERYSSVVVGSDQLWRPANIAGNFYTLNFVPEHINKISYATSFGLKEIRNNQREIAANFLKRIQYLSCREESGVEIVKKLTNRNAKLVCDPTLLLTHEDWNGYISTKPIISGKYILIYLLSNNSEHREFIRELSKKTGYKIVGVLHGSGYIKGDDAFVDEAPENIGPFEFLNLIKNASVVCTDSFHGSVFSTLFEKDFFVFKRFSDSDKMSTNNRVTNLLKKFGLSDRLVDTNSKVLVPPIDYEKVNIEIEKFRSESLEYLTQALTGK